MDRSGSCKFASLLVRELFGGVLRGNESHVFVRRKGKIFDINMRQGDVVKLGEFAHVEDGALKKKAYRESLASCIPRVNRWISVFEARYQLLQDTKEPLRTLAHQ